MKINFTENKDLKIGRLRFCIRFFLLAMAFGGFFCNGQVEASQNALAGGGAPQRSWFSCCRSSEEQENGRVFLIYSPLCSLFSLSFLGVGIYRAYQAHQLVKEELLTCKENIQRLEDSACNDYWLTCGEEKGGLSNDFFGQNKDFETQLRTCEQEKGKLLSELKTSEKLNRLGICG